MTASGLNAFLAQLTSFSKQAAPVPPARLDWEEVLMLVYEHGLAGIVSYQLDYRFLARLQPPAEVRDQLTAAFNATVNDNVLKVTHLRRLLSLSGAEAPMPEAVVLGPASWIDGLYPHIAFRTIDDVDLWVLPDRLAQAQSAFAEGGLLPRERGTPRPSRPVAARLASPDIQLSLWTGLAGMRLDSSEVAALWSRKGPVRAYGPVAARLDPADAVVSHVAALGLDGFAVPRIRLVDLREMLLRADEADGFYGPKSPALKGRDIVERARTFGLLRPLWSALRLVQVLFPEATQKASGLLPELPAQVARLLEETVVQPALDPRRTKVIRAAVALRRVLLA